MDITISAMWFVIALVFIITVIMTKVARGGTRFHPVCNRPPPPVVNCDSIIGLLHMLCTKGLQAVILDQYTKSGSVFTISLFGQKVTLLVGPEVSRSFFSQGLDSDLSPINLEFTVPMIGKDVGYGLDANVARIEQSRFNSDSLKPSNLRSHVGPMIQEVEVRI
ncbi:hypothetical protein BAE44_0005779 [Dichanthelium oligosanthes]|uniref:Uncharacterized protein n=1 Tax=Dichanthelium oligosanthes TaxID=888268 RepID=A0A1E5W724_9POAL|nr:hypothetical protein BAE44_0005779 [Dichanthelium oligosanthes]